MTEVDRHECDLFLLSSHNSYYANNALTNFAINGSRNIHGWGIGSYHNGRGNVLKSSEPALDRQGNVLSKEFSIAIRAVMSPVILGHLRLSSCGTIITENNHPFLLRFLNYDWMLIHNGTAGIRDLVPFERYLLPESNNDTARVFEYMREKIIDYCCTNPKHSLIEGCRNSYASLLEKDPTGKYNIILSNGYLSFVFIHWRSFYILKREKDAGDTVLISTLKLTRDEELLEIKPMPNKKAKMLVYSGPTLIFNGDIPK